MMADGATVLTMINKGSCIRLGLLLLGATAMTPVSDSADESVGKVPYDLPVVLPPAVRSPAVATDAPYTPTVARLLEQLLPENATAALIRRAATLLTGGSSRTCYAAGSSGAPRGTRPRILPLCWADGQGINWLRSPGQTTAPMEMVGLAASFDRAYANAWGQVEGREGRELMVTGLLGPQADLVEMVNWRRAPNSGTGEDPYLGGEMAAAAIEGIQGAGLMAQVKHFGPYNGTDEQSELVVQDQAMHEMVLAPFEAGVRIGGAAALMASYQRFRIDVPSLRQTIPSLEPGAPRSAPGGGPRTWPLNESHFSSEQPWLLQYVLRELWGSKAFVGPDYGGIHSASAILQGLDMEPGSDFLGSRNPVRSIDPTGDTCADRNGIPQACEAPGAIHVAGIPSPVCGVDGCGATAAAARGTLSLAVIRQALARVLYQEERFGLLGCDERTAACPNPGGVGEDRSGRAHLPQGPASGPVVVGTRNGDAAIVETGAERGAVLLKDDGGVLPIAAGDLDGGVAITGGAAEHLVAAPFDEAATGFGDRIAVGPLAQLERLSGRPAAFHYSPANDATGRMVPSSALSTSRALVTGHLERRRDGEEATVDAEIDYTLASGHGRLLAGRYTWNGYIYVPRVDAYTFRFQVGPDSQTKVSFALDGEGRTLDRARSFYNGYYYGAMPVPVARTVAGYVEPGLLNLECHSGVPPTGWEPPGTPPERMSRAPAHPCPSSLALGFHAVSIHLDAARPTSFRFAFSREKGDIADAAAEARGKALAVVFADDGGIPVLTSQNGRGWVSDATTEVAGLPPRQVELIEAVATANPRTVVVLNTGAPVLVPWIDRVAAVLEMWNAGQEGGTATARLLLGRANPSGHTPLTWPLTGTDTVYGHRESASELYPGSSAGRHPERLNGLPDGSSSSTQGIYVGYRYFDKLSLPVRFPFGHGLSYATFRYHGLRVRDGPGPVSVEFDVENTGPVAGTAVPQLYVGPAPDVPTNVQQAIRSLRGFDRISSCPERPGMCRSNSANVPSSTGTRRLSSGIPLLASARFGWAKDSATCA